MFTEQIKDNIYNKHKITIDELLWHVLNYFISRKGVDKAFCVLNLHNNWLLRTMFVYNHLA